MEKIIENAKGWECPNCHKIWAPTVKTCSCNVKETKEKSKDKLLNE